MTKSAIMEPKESIYEEIVTRNEQRRGDRSVSCPASRKSSRDMGRYNNSLSNLKNSTDNDDSLYAVVNGDDIEFKKLKDLLEDDTTKRNIYQKFCGDVNRATGVMAQAHDKSEDKEFGDGDSGCDCSTMGMETGQSNQLIRPNRLELKENSETIYSEILHQTPGSQIDLFPGRLTRESENPLLRQDVIPSNTPSPSTSIPPSRSGSIRRSKNDECTRSTSGDSGIQEDVNAMKLYENCARSNRKLHRSQSSPQFYANAASLSIHSPNAFYANMESNEMSKSVISNANSVYANMEHETENNIRPRTASRPIAIQSSQKKLQTELIYSDLDFEGETAIPEYLSSSPGDTSSTSSGLSSFTTHLTNSVSPPPLPSRPPSVYARGRQTSFSSISMTSSFASNNLRANFIGTQTVQRANKDSINSSIKETVHKTNMLDVKSAFVEISRNAVKFCSLSSPYNCIIQFSLDEMHLMDYYSKDRRFIGFIVSQPGKEAVCHVFQSDHAAEILDAVKENFKESPLKQRLSLPNRANSVYGKSDKSFYHSDIISIGSVKVKKSLLVINDCIQTSLEKINPKEYARVNLEINEDSVLTVTSEAGVKQEEHSIAWILSLGLYNNDGRYFGFIVSRTKGGKTRMFCHVFKCSTVMMSATVLEGIRCACQNTMVQNRNQAPRCSSSMPRSVFRSSRLISTPDTVSRTSVSSDETLRDTGAPLLSSDVYGESTPKAARSLSFNDDKQEHREEIVNAKNKAGGYLEGLNQSSTSDANDSVISQDVEPSDKELHCSMKEEQQLEKPVQNILVLDEADGNAKISSTNGDCIERKTNEIDAIELTPDASRGIPVFKGNSSKTDSDAATQSKEQQNESHESQKDKKMSFRKSKAKMFRGSLLRKKKDSTSKLSASLQSLDCTPREEEELPMPVEREEHNFVISYLCSTVVKPPLKSKHVEKCLKQYQKEVGKKQKAGDVCSLGSKLLLRITTDEGITLLDVRNPQSFRRHFPISTIDTFVVHPENPDCFAFSTTVPGDEQHKYHLFYKSRESVESVKEAFEHLKQFQKYL